MGMPANQLDAAPEIGLIDDPARAAIALHPIRRRLLEALTEPDSATGLAKQLKLSRQKVNYHLRELEEAGMVEATGETRQRRGCQERLVRAACASYLIDPTALGLGSAPDPESMKDRFSSSYLIALAAKAIRDLSVLRRRAGSVGKKLPTFSMHADVSFGSQRALHAFTEDLASSIAECIARHHENTENTENTTNESREFRFFVGSYPTITKSEAEADAEARAHQQSNNEDQS